MGYDYLYVKDGNDVEQLIEAFREVKDKKHPVVVHINTLKGKGYKLAEEQKERFHYSVPFDLETGNLTGEPGKGEDYADLTAGYLLQEMKKDPTVVGITAGTPTVFGFTPERRKEAGRQFIDVGIAEEQAVAMASAIAAGGGKPVFGVYSTFIQRAYDQLSQDLCINNNPALILVFWGSLSSMNDVTHLCLFDIPVIGNIPNMVYLAPTCREEYMAMLEWGIRQTEHPVAIRVPANGVVRRNVEPEKDYGKTLNRYEVSHRGEKVAILGLGSFYQLGEAVAARLKEEKGMDAVSLEGGYIAWLLDAMKQEEEVDICKDVELSIRKKFRKSIWCKFTKALNEYELVKPGDKIAVCISGGKDSMLMAKLFQELKRHNKFDFEVKFLVMDPGYSPANRQVIEENAKRLEIPIEIFESDIFESVYNVEKSPCYLCARMRRGYLYSHAQKMGCNKIALGHHYDDVIETILMGMLYSAQFQTMMPKLHSTNFEGMELIRPLYLVREDAIKAWRDYNDLHFIQCACKFTDTCTTCNNEENQSKRMETKELIARLKKVNPYVEGNIFKSVENVNLDTIVAYKQKGVKHHFLDEYDR